MKLARIQVDNFLGAHHIDVKLTTPVTLFAGPNGACKSSISEAVRMAMTGDVVRVKLKKEYEQLVTDGNKQGGALITAEDEAAYSFNLPGGDRKVDDGLPVGEAVNVCLNGQRFSLMDDGERRTFLFSVAGIKIKADDIKARMLARACDPAKTEATVPMLRTGFPAACDFAKNKATEAKGAWRKVTAAPAYGSKVAEKWAAELPEELTTTAPTAEELAAFEAKVAALNTEIGAVTAKVSARKEAAAKRAALKEQADSVDRVRENWVRVSGELNDYAPKVTALRERASGTKRVGLVHDFARFVGDLKRSNDEKENQTAAELLDRYEDEHGALAPAGDVDADAQASLPEFERGLEVLQNSEKNLARDLQAAEAAKGQYDLLGEVADEPDLPDLTKLQAALVECRAERDRARQRAGQHEEYAAKVAAAEQRTKDAAAHHADVTAWLVLADALAPDGIPADLLKEALAPINASLAEAAEITGWQTVCITQDMEITANGRPYGLLSESEKWRADATIAITVARLSGVKILMLDRVDVLDLPGRGKLLALVNTLVTEGDINTALLFATLKGLPAALYPTMTAHWVEAGAIVELKAAA